MLQRRTFFKWLGGVWTAALAGPATSLGQDLGETTGPVESSPSPAIPPPFPGVGDDKPIRLDFDLVVVGGGIAGTTAAIAAARNGLRVALVHNRSMLGGNSSSEVKLFPENNSGHQPWIKESGIHDEYHTEERVRNHFDYREGTMNCHWDLVLYEKAFKEPKLKLFLNAHMHRAKMKSPNEIESIHAIQLGTEKTFDLFAPLFVDATGDGVLAHRAGADYRWGREAQSEYGEFLAPPVADEEVMGSTLFFRALDTGHPVPFTPPDWAAVFETDDDLPKRRHSYIEGGYWWIEVGAPYHPIKDNEEIRHEAMSQLLGVWDHIKNRGDHGAENYGLEFVGFWPYKRECRRILGDHVLTEPHLLSPQPLPDAVAYGCWGIDIHVQGGILNREIEPYPPPGEDQNWETMGASIYPIPLRSLYSRNVHNLMMAGRPISGSYVAFASTRVLSTGAIVGQAVGTAAALCRRKGILPAEAATKHIREIQQTLLRHDCHIPGIVNEDEYDLARSATITASSEATLAFPDPDRERELNMPHAQLFPFHGNRIDSIEILLRSSLASDAELTLGLRSAPAVWDFRSTTDLATSRSVVPAGQEQWVKFTLNSEVEPEKLYYVHVPASPGVFWKAFYDVEGSPSLTPVGSTPASLPGKSRWRPICQGNNLCTRISPDAMPYGPSNINRGTNRPDQWTNLWISDPAQPLPAWVELKWGESVQFNTVQLTFDTNTIRRELKPLFRYPDCVKKYRIETAFGSEWRTILEVDNNYSRSRVHRFPAETGSALRVVVLETNGGSSARIYEIRLYNESVEV